MDPDCAICRAPATLACDCEAKGLEVAVRQAESRMMQSIYNDIRYGPLFCCSGTAPGSFVSLPRLSGTRVLRLANSLVKHLGPWPRPRLHFGVLPAPHGPAEASPFATSGAYHGTRLSLLPRSAPPQRDFGRPSSSEAGHRRGLAELGPAIPGGARILLQPRRAVAPGRRRGGRAGSPAQCPLWFPESGTPRDRPHPRQRRLRSATITAGGQDAASSREGRHEADAGAAAASLPAASAHGGGAALELLSPLLRYPPIAMPLLTPDTADPTCPAGAAPLSSTSPGRTRT